MGENKEIVGLREEIDELKRLLRFAYQNLSINAPAPVVTDLLWVTSESPERLQGVDVLIEVD